jgi:SAM-dependent methyltransferase
MDMNRYNGRMKNEIRHYEEVFDNRLFQEVPNIWLKVEEHFSRNIKRFTGVSNIGEYISRHVGQLKKKEISILGLGSGACGVEFECVIPLLEKQGCKVTLACADINGKVLEQASNEASKRNVLFTPLVMDVNKIRCMPGSYDVIIAYAALHHFLDLNHIAREINNGLKEDGIFVTVDIPTRNGYMMWDKTYEIVKYIWLILPERFKWDHTKSIKPVLVKDYENTDYSVNSFECINSEQILPALRKHLSEKDFVPSLGIGRRFFDTKFGPNFNYNDPLDSSIFHCIMNLDQYYISNKILRPETFLGAYGKKKSIFGF